MFKRILILATLAPFVGQLTGCSCSKRPDPPLPTEPGLYIKAGEFDVVNSSTLPSGEYFEGQDGTSEMIFTVWLEPRRQEAVTVDYEYVVPAEAGVGVATSGTDFEPVQSATLTFEPGEQTKYITVVIKGDTLYERGEEVELKLLNSSGPTIRVESDKGVILNDDEAPVASIALATGNSDQINEVDGETRNLTVTLDQVSGVDAVLDLSWPSVTTASPGNKAAFIGDYVILDSSDNQFLSNDFFVIPAGETTASFKVQVIDDGLEEDDEGFYVGLRSLPALDDSAYTDVTVHNTAGQASMTVLANDAIDYTIPKTLNDTGIVFVQSTDVTLNPYEDANQGRDSEVLSKTGTGVDGFDFTKLDANGDALADQNMVWDKDNPATWWYCVLDNTTGRVWEMKIPDTIHGSSVTIPWFNPDPNTNGGYAGTVNAESCDYSTQTGAVVCNTLYYTTHMNVSKICGRTGWRLPQIEELRGIVDYSTGGLDPNVFPTISQESLTGEYWTATSGPHSGSVSSTAYILKVKEAGEGSADGARLKDDMVRVGVRMVTDMTSKP